MHPWVWSIVWICELTRDRMLGRQVGPNGTWRRGRCPNLKCNPINERGPSLGSSVLAWDGDWTRCRSYRRREGSMAVSLPVLVGWHCFIHNAQQPPNQFTVASIGRGRPRPGLEKEGCKGCSCCKEADCSRVGIKCILVAPMRVARYSGIPSVSWTPLWGRSACRRGSDSIFWPPLCVQAKSEGGNMTGRLACRYQVLKYYEGSRIYLHKRRSNHDCFIERLIKLTSLLIR